MGVNIYDNSFDITACLGISASDLKVEDMLNQQELYEMAMANVDYLKETTYRRTYAFPTLRHSGLFRTQSDKVSDYVLFQLQNGQEPNACFFYVLFAETKRTEWLKKAREITEKMNELAKEADVVRQRIEKMCEDSIDKVMLAGHTDLEAAVLTVQTELDEIIV